MNFKSGQFSERNAASVENSWKEKEPLTKKARFRIRGKRLAQSVMRLTKGFETDRGGELKKQKEMEKLSFYKQFKSNKYKY